MSDLLRPASPASIGVGYPAAGRFWLAFAALVVMAAALRTPGLNHSLTIDEAGSIAQASAPDFWVTARQDVHPPLYYGLLRLGLVFTPSYPLLKLFSLTCGVGLLVLAVWVLRHSLPAACIVGTILAGLPEFSHHSQQLRPYALLLFLLGLALLLSIRIFAGLVNLHTLLSLTLVLVIAAATHLLTAFFLLALLPLLVWPYRVKGWRHWITAVLPLAPAGLLLLWFKFGFVSQPADLAGGWWLPFPTADVVLNAFSSVTGWQNVQWLADACSWRIPGSGVVVRLVAIASLGYALLTGWGRRRGEPLTWALLGSALIYLSALIIYSRLSEPLVMARTLLPGLLPLVGAMAWGIETHPIVWRRHLAAASMAIYITLAAVPAFRLALVPVAGLQGMAGTARAAYHPGDTLVLFRSMDYGLAAYWPDVAKADALLFDQTQPSGPQFAELRRRLDRLDHSARILLAYRDDYYLQQHRDILEAVLAELASRGSPAGILWQENELTLLIAERPAHP